MTSKILCDTILSKFFLQRLLIFCISLQKACATNLWRCEMVRLALFLAVLTLSACSALAEEMSGPSLGGSIDYPALYSGWSSSNTNTYFSLSGNEGYGYAHINLKNHVLNGASWNFFVDRKNTSIFYATLSAHGELLEENQTSLSFDDLRQDIIFYSDVKFHQSLTASVDDKKNIQLYGYFNIFPATIDETFFNYYEHESWKQDGTINWNVSMQYRGHFLGENASELGAMFVSVPEPSSIFLLFCAIGVILTLWLRRKPS